ncbi:MAG: hypothetical protein IPG39_19440 [Bacteroidetes bacterium]|nr:hypothetical protein [Bacteroidota bacterium]
MRHPKILKGIPVFVLIGRKTYSSAIINVMDFKKYSNVTLIGEETAGNRIILEKSGNLHYQIQG